MCFLFTRVNLLKGENFFHFFEPPLNEKVTFFVSGYSRKKRMEKYVNTIEVLYCT
jgi:hypothetical protein